MGPPGRRWWGLAGCPCEGVEDPLELAVCLAPPPGEHEVALPGLQPGVSVVVNSEGVWLRSVAVDEWLPFMRSVERRASRAAVEAALRAAGMGPRGLVCLAARALAGAAASGSGAAWEKLERCRGLVEKILGECRRRGGEG